MEDELILTATEAKNRLIRGELSARELLEHCVARINAYEPQVEALAYWNLDDARRNADACDARKERGILAGLPLGVKDIIDVSNMPTGCDSSLYTDYRPAADAACVAHIKANGGWVLGKTRTTEFAFSNPTSTRNPHSLRYTPGGSSSGSAAGVASGFFPLALGTQTGGSVIRPASYCGIYAFKPTFNVVSREGIKPLSENLDTLGWYGRSVEDLRLLNGALRGTNTEFLRTTPKRCTRIGLCRTPRWHQADNDMQRLVEDSADRLGAQEVELPDIFDQVYDDHSLIMAVDAARSLRAEYIRNADQLSSALIALIERGLKVAPNQELKAHQRLAQARERLDALYGHYDILLSPSAPGAAPPSLETTGDSVFNRLWTAMQTPSISIPAGFSTTGMPLGIQLVGQRYADYSLLANASLIAEAIAVPLRQPAFA
ncbi:MAG: hypothetical protein COB32_13205 [Halomonas sp.]|jgi:Asp-tRNA(Asn)/Glu-tRNA(Gln) amidotransferase A subunit family amidase|nr:MAG: hypothetical protein COB32_13205 [Halomonas sp.]|tara:strand:+ start:13732 stop:15024 length:1293 start_codon:yes stop_codon:yes gene_type:complete